MPVYNAQCHNCKEFKTVKVSFNEEFPALHCHCGGIIAKVFSPPAIIIK